MMMMMIWCQSERKTSRYECRLDSSSGSRFSNEIGVRVELKVYVQRQTLDRRDAFHFEASWREIDCVNEKHTKLLDDRQRDDV